VGHEGETILVFSAEIRI